MHAIVLVQAADDVADTANMLVAPRRTAMTYLPGRRLDGRVTLITRANGGVGRRMPMVEDITLVGGRPSPICGQTRAPTSRRALSRGVVATSTVRTSQNVSPIR